MPVFLDTQDADFEKNFTALLSAKREDSPDVDSSVARIIADVQERRKILFKICVLSV